MALYKNLISVRIWVLLYMLLHSLFWDPRMLPQLVWGEIWTIFLGLEALLWEFFLREIHRFRESCLWSRWSGLRSYSGPCTNKNGILIHKFLPGPLCKRTGLLCDWHSSAFGSFQMPRIDHKEDVSEDTWYHFPCHYSTHIGFLFWITKTSPL